MSEQFDRRTLIKMLASSFPILAGVKALESQTNAPNIVTPDPTTNALTSDQLSQVINTDPAVLSDPRLSFARFITNLVSPGAPLGSVPQATLEAVVQTMLGSFNQTSFTNPASGIVMPVLAQGFSNLTPAGLLDPVNGAQLIAIVSRADLAILAMPPPDGSSPPPGLTGGEQRMIFSVPINSPVNGNGGHTFIIVECNAPLLPGDPTGSVYPKFWNAMPGLTASQKTDAFEQLFYTGYSFPFRLPANPGEGPPPMPPPPIPPLASIENLGYEGFGAVRFNGIPGASQAPNPNAPPPVWELDQFVPMSGPVSFLRTVVSSVPYNVLYQAQTAGEDPLVTFQRPIFQDRLVNEVIPSITSPIVAASRQNKPLTQAQLLFILATTNTCSWEHCAPQSISGIVPGFPQFNDDASVTISPALGARISAGLPSGISFSTVANGLTSTTCGGCHQISNGAALPGGVTQPFSNSFTHVDDTVNHNESQYLTQHMLPFRFAQQTQNLGGASASNLATVHLKLAPLANSAAVSSGTSTTMEVRDKAAFGKAVSDEVARIQTVTPPETSKQAAIQEIYAKHNVAERTRAQYFRLQK